MRTLGIWHCCAITIAAAIVGNSALIPSTNLVEIINTDTSTSESRQNISALNTTTTRNDFPPAPQPPYENFVYNISFNTDTPISLKFFQYRPLNQQSQPQLETAFKEAISQAVSISHKRDELLSPAVLYEWGQPEANVWVTPSGADQETGVGLTWGILTQALVGMNRFRLAYPELVFSCIVKIYFSGKRYSVAVVRINSRHVLQLEA